MNKKICKLMKVTILAVIFSSGAVYSEKKGPSPEAIEQAKLLKELFSGQGMFSDLKPGSAQVKDVPDMGPFPTTVTEAEVNRSLGIFAKAFFISKGYDGATVEFDKFLLPNFNNVNLKISWNSVKTVSGKEVMDKTKPVSENLDFKNSEEIPVKEFNEEDALYEARGNAVIKIPVKYATFDFSVADLNKASKKGDYEITLLSMQNDVYKVLIKHINGKDIKIEDIVIIPVGEKGKLKSSESMSFVPIKEMPDFVKKIIADLESGKLTVEQLNNEMEKHTAEMQTKAGSIGRIFSARAMGVVKGITVMIRAENIEKKFEILATAEPDTTDDNPAKPRASRYINNPKPVFKKFTEDELKKNIKIFSNRSSATFGYNVPEVVCEVPEVSNSDYSIIEFKDTVLLDKNNKNVEFELESGGYSSEKHSSEIRFQQPDSNGKSLVVYEKAKGKINIKYPVKIKTVTLSRNSPDLEKYGISVNGKYITYNKEKVIRSENSFIKIYPVRGFDATGFELRKLNYFKSEYNDNGEFETSAFWGEPEKIEMDIAEEWAEFELEYSLPPIKMLPPMQ